MYAVLVVAGGASRRYGTDKLAVLLDDVLAGLPADAYEVVCVGPQRPTPTRPGVRWTREEPPLGGPLAAVAAGLAALTPHGADVVVVVGGDMPYVGRAVPALVTALDGSTADAAVLVDAGGRRQQLAGAWRRAALTGAVDAVGPPTGLPLHRLLAGVAVVQVDDAWGAALDVDTPADLP